MNVYRNGVFFTEIGDPYDLERWALENGIDPTTLSLDLAEVKTYKENEIRDLGDLWYRTNIRAFEGAIVGVKAASNLSGEEQKIKTAMQDNYTRIRQLVSQVRNATTVQAALAVMWADPEALASAQK